MQNLKKSQLESPYTFLLETSINNPTASIKLNQTWVKYNFK